MPVFNRGFQLTTTLLVAFFCCRAGADETQSASPSSPLKVARSDEKAPLVQQPGDSEVGQQTDADSASPAKPSVILSDAHKATCVKQVGDEIGNVEVTDIDGTTHKLKDILSDRFTVLVFWSEKSVFAREQFQRIPVDILGAFAKHRVKVVAANVGGDPVSTRRLTGDAADKIVSLVDSEAKLFGQFAKSCFPRTYVLDKTGKILWFDIEYSQSTRRELANALNYFLARS